MPKISEIVGFTIKDHNRYVAEMSEAKLITADDLIDGILEKQAKGPGPHGLRWPWEKNQDRFAFGEGHLTVLAGENGAGKSTVATQISMHLCASTTVGILSLEMDEVDLGDLMSTQWLGRDGSKTAESLAEWAAEMRKRMWLFENPTDITAERVLGALWAMHDKGVKFVVLDNLQCIKLSTKYDDEKEFLNQLAAVARLTGMHICLVHHLRKSSGDSANQRPTKDRVLGSGAITNIAQNVLLLWADEERQKLAMIQQSGKELLMEDRKKLDGPDLVLTVAKQRFGESYWPQNLWWGNARLLKDQQFGGDCKPGRSL